MSPEDAILDELHRTLNNVVALEDRVRELGMGDGGIYGSTFHVSGLPTGEAKPHVLVVMLNEERNRLTRVSAEAIKANVTQRHIELMEADARSVAASYRVFASLLGLDPDDPVVRKAGRKAIEAIGRGVVVEGSATELDAA
jgi:hypothetical protein